MERLFINLIINAAQSFGKKDGVDNRIEVAISSAPESAVVEIADNGCGIGPETAEHIFNPFFTTKPAGEGTGLGLAICKSIVDELGGKIEFESESGEGTRFRVILPAHEEKSAERAEAPVGERRRRTSSGSIRTGEEGAPAQEAKVGRLLLIDDEPNVARALEAFLNEDFEVEIAHCGSKGLELIATGREFGAVLCDLSMPNMNGAQFYKKLAEIDPDLAGRTVLMTGILGSALTELLGPDIRCPLLQKPFDPDEAKRLLLRLIKDGPQASD
jgi:CheY-like chemotaxis protein